MILMIDNYDSFTYNLVQYFQELGEEISVYYNDKITVPDIKNLNPQYIVVSPGPGCPQQAGISLDVIREFAGKIAILGVCLGHQAIAQVFGANIIPAEKVMHGKISKIYHSQKSVFRNLTIPFDATRYHSLIIDPTTLSQDFEVTAWTQSLGGEPHEIMGIAHRHYPLTGVQFHPESILTQPGHQILKNFLNNM